MGEREGGRRGEGEDGGERAGRQGKERDGGQGRAGGGGQGRRQGEEAGGGRPSCQMVGSFSTYSVRFLRFSSARLEAKAPAAAFGKTFHEIARHAGSHSQATR